MLQPNHQNKSWHCMFLQTYVETCLAWFRHRKKHLVRKKIKFWIKSGLPDFVGTNTAGYSPNDFRCHKDGHTMSQYSLKKLEQWSLAWQPPRSGVTPSPPHSPSGEKVSSYTCNVNAIWFVLSKCMKHTKLTSVVCGNIQHQHFILTTGASHHLPRCNPLENFTRPNEKNSLFTIPCMKKHL